MDDHRSSHTRYACAIGESTDGLDTDPSSCSDHDDDDDSSGYESDEDGDTNTALIEPSFVTDYAALPPDRGIGFPRIVCTKNTRMVEKDGTRELDTTGSATPELKLGQLYDICGSDAVVTFLYGKDRTALSAFLNEGKKSFLFHYQGNNSAGEQDVIIYRVDDTVVMGTLGQSGESIVPGFDDEHFNFSWGCRVEYDIHHSGRWIFRSACEAQSGRDTKKEIDYRLAFGLIFDSGLFTKGATMEWSLSTPAAQDMKKRIHSIGDR